MAFIKYSMGGPITSVEDNESVEKREEVGTPLVTTATHMVICKKCGLQHMISENETRVCCGTSIKTDKLS